MGITPPASALAHVALIQNPATRPPPLIPIAQTPAHIPASSLQLNTQPNPFLATALPTQAASLQPQMGACPALPVEANAASLLMGTGTCPLPEPIRKKILNLEYIDMADLPNLMIDLIKQLNSIGMCSPINYHTPVVSYHPACMWYKFQPHSYIMHSSVLWLPAQSALYSVVTSCSSIIAKL